MRLISRTELVYFATLLLALIAIFEFNVLAGGTITSPQHLAIDLGSPPDSPQDWGIQSWGVVKYRALFRMLVQGSWAALFAPDNAWGFYLVFVFWSLVFFYCTTIAFYFYLRVLEFDRRASMAGCLLFLASPPVLLAYKYPVYTREDVLTYFLVLLGLLAIFKLRLFLTGLISAAAVLTRETTLILPLTYFLASEESWRKRALVWAMPVLALAGIRIVWGFEVGNNFESSVLNFQKPWETLGFIFCVFGALWLPYLVGLVNRWQRGDFPNFAWKVLASTGPLILVALLGATLLLARAREARIPFLLFPWAIPFALDWFRANYSQLRALARNYTYWVFAFAVFGCISAIILYFHLTNPELMRYYLADFKNGYWLGVGALHLSATLAILLPLLRRQRIAQAT